VIFSSSGFEVLAVRGLDEVEPTSLLARFARFEVKGLELGQGGEGLLARASLATPAI